MPKKFAVLLLFASIAVGLFYFKKMLVKPQFSSPLIILNWQHSPEKIVVNQEVEFSIRLKDKNNLPITNGQMDIVANMNHAGMIPINTRAMNFPDGLYKTKLKFTMSGDWILFLTIKFPDGYPDGTIVTKEIFLKIE